MTNDELIGRGDARKVADEVFDRLEKKGADQAAFGAAEVCEALAALPAQGVDALVEARERIAALEMPDAASELANQRALAIIDAIREGRK